jgi:hypothetical protein
MSATNCGSTQYTGTPVFCVYRRRGAVRSLTEQGRFPAVKYCLFSPDSPVWKTDLRNALMSLLDRGCDDFKTYVNVRDFFFLLVQGLETGVDSIRQESIVKILFDHEFVGRMWKTVISRAVQWRMQINFIQGRALLIENGVSDDLMPLTDELQSRIRDENLKNKQ